MKRCISDHNKGLLLDLTNAHNPKATGKMILVIENLYATGFISGEQLYAAKRDFFLASDLIDKYQEEMHMQLGMNIQSGNNPQAYLYNISQIVAQVDDEMSIDAHSSGYGYEYDNDPYSWGTDGEIHCSDDM